MRALTECVLISRCFLKIVEIWRKGDISETVKICVLHNGAFLICTADLCCVTKFYLSSIRTLFSFKMCFLTWSRSEIHSEKDAIACIYLHPEQCERKGPLTTGYYMVTRCSACSCGASGVTQYFQTYTDSGCSPEEQVNALWWSPMLCCGLWSPTDPMWVCTIMIYNYEWNCWMLGEVLSVLFCLMCGLGFVLGFF